MCLQLQRIEILVDLKVVLLFVVAPCIDCILVHVTGLCVLEVVFEWVIFFQMSICACDNIGKLLFFNIFHCAG